MSRTDDIFDTMGAPMLDERNVTAVRLSRPQRVSDGAGGSIETMGDVVTLMCDPVIGDGEFGLSVPAEADIRVGDLIEVEHSLFL